MGTHNAANPVSAVGTTVEILELMKEREGATLVELAGELDIAKSTIHRHLSTLRQEGYIIREGDVYHISLHLFDLASYNRERNPLFRIGRPIADDVADEVEERVSLVVPEQHRVVKCYMAESDRSVRTDAHLGLAMHMHCTSGGKAILAHMDEEQREAVIREMGLDEMTDNTITSEKALRTELEKIREERVSWDDQERLTGVRGVAAPILNKETDEVIGALDVAGPSTRLDGEAFDSEIPNLVRRAADEIEVNVQYWRRD
ncbi:IclR family transcriptional regulator [Haloarcula laminariae]|uniref:IclR family transcriptional regulator n=1 Tax=Haloarcula laminariae TaxID=2961577 RepID=UPI0021CAB645|nr:IclR family transcriptional regulator [Halomicroarcula laminariae]